MSETLPLPQALAGRSSDSAVCLSCARFSVPQLCKIYILLQHDVVTLECLSLQQHIYSWSSWSIYNPMQFENHFKRNLRLTVWIVGYFRDPMETTTWTILKDSKRIWTGSFLQWHSETRCKIRAWPREDEPSRVCYYRIYYDDIKVFPTVMSYDCDIMNYDIQVMMNDH